MFHQRTLNKQGKRLACISLLSISAATFPLSVLAGSIFTTTNSGNGITGETKDTAGMPVGVKGIANGTILGGGTINSIGVEGVSTSDAGTGVKGTGGLYGVYGESTAGSLFSPSYGVYGKGDAFSYAIYSDGAAHVQGSLSVSGDLTVAGAVDGNNAADKPVCADTSGKLGPCNSLSYSSKVAYVGDGPESYPSIEGALFWSPTWCGTPTSSSRCVIKVGPGVHDVGNQNLTLLSNFTIEGEGPDETIITGGTAATTINIYNLSGVILRKLAIKNTSTGNTRTPLKITASSDIKLEDVRIRTGTGESVIGIDISDSDVKLKDIDIDLTVVAPDTATGIKAASPNLNNIVTLENVRIEPYAFAAGSTTGIETTASSVKINNLHVTDSAQTGILVGDGTTRVRHSLINAYDTSIKTNGVNAAVIVNFSELSSNTADTSGSITCTAVTQGNSFNATNCP